MTRKRKELKQNKETRHKNPKQEMTSDSTDEDPPLLEDYQICLVTSTLLFAVYTASLHPSVPGGDSGELINSAHELGVAHPPGYPIFTILAKAVMVFVRYGSPAWRVNLLNAAFSAVAGGFLQISVLRLTSDIGTSILAVGLFCLSQLTWIYSVSAEVFSLNNCLISVIIFLTIEFEFSLDDNGDEVEAQVIDPINKSAVKIAGIGCLVSGLVLSNQHTSVLYVGPVALWVLVALYKKQYLTSRVLIFFCSMMVLGLLPYLYIPISAHLNIARWTWGDQRTFDGLMKHLLRSEYGTFDLGKEMEGAGFVTGVTAYFEHAYNNMLGVGPVLALVGCIASVTIRHGNGDRSLFVFIIMLAAYISFFAWRANLNINEALFRGVVERFWMQSDLVVSLLAAVGFHPIVRVLTVGCIFLPWPLGRWATQKVLGRDKKSMTAVFTMIFGVSIIAVNLQNFQTCNQSKNLVVRDFASTILKKLPQNSIVLTKGDLPTNSMRYLHLVEGMRPDVSLIDVEVLSYEWSLPMLKKSFHNVIFPGDFWHTTPGTWSDGRESFTLEMLLNTNYNRAPIFACVGMTERDLSWEKEYTLWPFGPCVKVVKKTEKMNPKEWAGQTQDFGAKWKYAVDSFPNTSWEKVANDEMWQAKISSAFYMYGMSEEAQSPKTKTDYLLAAHDLYFAAIKNNQESGRMTFTVMYPSYWHKNYALVCERLLYVESHHSKSQLCKSAVYHFEQYIAANKGDDPEIDNIAEAVKNLHSRIDTYEKLDRIQKTFEPKV